FAPDVCRDRTAYLPRDLWFEHLYSNPRAALVPAEDLIASMDAAGVDRSILAGFPWRDPGLCREHNDYMAEAVRTYPERLAWLGTVSPLDPGAAAEAARCFDA